MILSNGINVIFYPMCNTHSVTMGLYIKAGQLCGEPKEGITHLLEHLHFRQAGNLSQKELYYKMESIGSTLRAATYRDFFKFTMKIVPEYIDECLDIFSCLFDVNMWNKELLQSEKKVILNQIAEKGEYVTVEQLSRDIVFLDHPLSRDIMGTDAQIEEITLDDVKLYKTTIMNPHNLLFCITGNFSDSDKTRIIKNIEKLTFSLDSKQYFLSKPLQFGNRNLNISLLNTQDNNPIEVDLSFDIVFGEEERDLLKLLNCIIGEGVGSRLQRIIREEKCYSSDISSYIEWYHSFAVMHITFSVKKQLFEDCLTDVICELRAVKQRVGKEDLDVTLPFYTINHVFNEDDTEEMNFQLAYNKLIFNKAYKPMSIKNDESTLKDICNIANKYLICKNMCIAVGGNIKGIPKRVIKQILLNLDV